MTHKLSRQKMNAAKCRCGRSVFSNKMVSAGCVALLLIGVLYFGNMLSAMPVSGAGTWEYEILTPRDCRDAVTTDDAEDVTDAELDALRECLLDELNVAGGDGWELVDVVSGAVTAYVFKKEQ